MNIELILRAEQFVTNLLKKELNPNFTYHNLNHTKMVVEGAIVIGNGENLTDEDMEILVLAAWFHDTGYVNGQQSHEEESVRIATEFLEQSNVDEYKISQVTNCILATKVNALPKEKIHMVIRDADMFHLSQDDYENYLDNLRKEFFLIDGKTYSDLEWSNLNINFLNNHQFYTDFAQKLILEKKEVLKKSLKKKIKQTGKEVDSRLIRDLGISIEELKVLKKKLLKVEGIPEKGIETMFRLTSKNHIELSAMADSKANIMISINTIIISVLLGSLMQKLDNNPHLILPTIILLIVTLSSIVYSILSLRPNITSGKFKKEDIANQDTNLLFFGNFHKMKREDYHWGMNLLMENASFLYSNLIDDIFFLGKVLSKKYDYLRIAYNIFMYGIIISVIVFVTAILFFDTSLA